MANLDVVVYNIAVFISTLFLLEYGADKFVDHAAVVARRTGIPETIVGLITAGGEWEELAVVVASLVHRRASLAIGNVVGSAISNILGAFALGLLFHGNDTPIRFDRSSRTYSLILLLLTTVVIPVISHPTRAVRSICGPVLIALFAIYICSVSWAVTQGILTAPEDSDESSDDDSSDEDIAEESTPLLAERTGTEIRHADENCFSPNRAISIEDNERSNQALQAEVIVTRNASAPSHKTRRTLRYHIFSLILGFFAICLAGYILSHAATTITDELRISDILFGIIVLAIATTLPEKFISVMSGRRGHAGILVANTAGSNIFLLTLCSGVIMTANSARFERGNVDFTELAVLWGATIAFTSTIWLDGQFNKWIGSGMLIAYVVFIVLEFILAH
ncbi:hypothetical protein yc1106_05306 [Curvularia clavata]|uniref:Sodium/calcium exchanger membrane region domain-containing protein n=1 Tax=Curvularia clavata TaxID=95742 RepID=A0A9Q8Z9G4_CURCL|nr:hypothetical protein yc1106_05306 [Curvularia clavata]